MTSNFRTRILLDEILKDHGPRSFGYICQLLLALTFIDLGFKVPVCKLTGRPDIIVNREAEMYAIEVKAPIETNVVIAQEDIDGVIKTDYRPVLAVLSYPEADTRWIIIDAKLMHPGKFNKISLEKYSLKEIENNVSDAFHYTIEKYFDVAKSGIKKLNIELEKYKS